MINSTNTINIDGNEFKEEAFARLFKFGSEDKFSTWVLRPIAMLSAVGMIAAMFFASAFLILISLSLMPLLALLFWAVRTKVQRESARGDDGVVDSQTIIGEKPATDL